MSTQNNQLENLVVRSIMERVLTRSGYSTDLISKIDITEDAAGTLHFEVGVEIPMKSLNIQINGSQDRKPELVMCHDDDL